MKKIAMMTDTRKVLSHFKDKTGKPPTEIDMLVAESLCYSFYSKTIIGHINRFYNEENEESDTMAFYIKPIMSINKGRRYKGNWSLQEIEIHKDKYDLIVGYLDVDYNHEAIKLIRDICSNYSLELIEMSIKVAVESDVYSVPFLARVIESQEVEVTRIADRRRRQRETQEDSRRDINPKNQQIRTPMEIAVMAMTWNDMINTAELERKLNDNDNKVQ